MGTSTTSGLKQATLMNICGDMTYISLHLIICVFVLHMIGIFFFFFNAVLAENQMQKLKKNKLFSPYKNHLCSCTLLSHHVV